MSAAHTPGPWWIAGKATIRFGDKAASGWIADVHWRNRTSNANLIGAAPDLLAACGQASFALREMLPDDHDAQMTVRMLEAAIAKARGEQS